MVVFKMPQNKGFLLLVFNGAKKKKNFFRKSSQKTSIIVMVKGDQKANCDIKQRRDTF